MIRSLIIFGATGDLTARYLMPALADLMEAGHLSALVKIVGVAQHPWGGEEFRRHIEKQLERHAAAVSLDARQALLARLEYQAADVTNPAQVAAITGALAQPVLAYLALPSHLFAPLLEALAAAHLAAGSRVMVEKPFGHNLASAQALNRLVHVSFHEEAVFRVDHFLGMPGVQNLLAMRLGNRLLEQLWSSRHIERIECIWDETLALEGRASYYDRTGALRDMVQSHLLQVLCLIGMEPPCGSSVDDLRDRKVELLRSIIRDPGREPAPRSRRARYGAGQIGRRALPAYAEEAGVDPARRTETFVELDLRIGNARWAGVPFMLRTGKALARDRQEVVVHFRPPDAAAGVLASNEDVRPNSLRLPLGSSRIALGLTVAEKPDPYSLQPLALEADAPFSGCPPYSRLLLDALKGEPSRSVRDDEVEESWRIVDLILEAWAAGASPLQTYPAGSDGPASGQPADFEISRTVS
ncbi:MAG TPA: glucose-6-phosphate dehydrogenase [Nitrospiraceae bacterium]|nr:glucose-6-phosphate dehydrogenase [Nitrospiraceae bacterium]